MKRVWKEKEHNRGFAESGDSADELVSRLLASRGVSPKQASDFLNPDYGKSHDPFFLKDMDRAVERILKAIENKERITVYADYDADAVTAVAVLLRFFKEIGYENVDYYIPDRFSEGYGMNTDAIKRIGEKGTKLIITVDCGINANEAIDEASRLGVDVVVTDHHQITGEIPNAAAVVNPHRPDDEYPFKDLTGVGVAFKLVQAIQNVIASEAKQSRGIATGLRPRDDIALGWEKWLLDLVAIGTVADCQSLLGENRVFVKWGMHVMGKTKWIGLKKLMELAGLSGQTIDTYKIGFIIAPRINAAGRIEHASLALELLLTDDDEQAAELADKLDALNRQRQNLTEQILSEAREQLVEYRERKILLAAGQDWPQGIVGLVAGKLTEEFYRPVLVLSKNGEEAVGSARSIGSFNIVEAIGQSHEILLRFGGHPQAAGFTLKNEHIEVFHKNLLDYADNVMDEETLAPVLRYDAEIKLDEIDEELVDLLEKFAPFGIGNPRPRFRMNNLKVRNIKKIGNGEKHLRMYVENFPCIGFNLGFWADKMKDSDLIDLICEPQWNEWNGSRALQLKLIDISIGG